MLHRVHDVRPVVAPMVQEKQFVRHAHAPPVDKRPPVQALTISERVGGMAGSATVD